MSFTDTRDSYVTIILKLKKAVDMSFFLAIGFLLLSRLTPGINTSYMDGMQINSRDALICMGGWVTFERKNPRVARIPTRVGEETSISARFRVTVTKK